MARMMDIETREKPQRRKRRWLLMFVVLILFPMLAGVGALIYLSRVIPELPNDIYWRDDLNAAAVIRVDTADAGLMALASDLAETPLRDDEFARIQTVLRTMIYPRARIFIRGGEGDVFSTRLLLVGHIRRLAPVLRYVLVPALKLTDIKPSRETNGVGVYQLPNGGWLASSGRAVILSNDPEWIEQTVAVQDKTVEAERSGAQRERPPLDEFARRCLELDTKNEFRALVRLDDERRRVARRVLKRLLVDPMPESDKVGVTILTTGMLDDAELLDVEVDLKPDDRATLVFRLVMTNRDTRDQLFEKLRHLRNTLVQGGVDLPMKLDRPAAIGSGEIELIVDTEDYPAIVELAR